MASVGLGILGAGALGTAATIYPKETLAATGLRTRSVKDVITGKKIRGSSSNRFLQLIGREKKEDAENKIKAAEKASAGKKGLVFVLNLLLQTLFKQQQFLTYNIHTRNLDPNSEWAKHLRAELLETMKGLKEREDRLLYIIAYSSFLTEPTTNKNISNLLKKIKTDFGLNRPDHEVTNWKKLYVRQPYLPDITHNHGRSRQLFLEKLSEKIDHVEEYIKIEKKIKEDAINTRDRRGLRMVVRKAAGDRKMDPTVSPYERGGIEPSHPRQRGPFFKMGEFIPDTENHEKRYKQILKASGSFLGGRRSQKRKTRKHRRKRKTRKRKTRKRKTQKSKTRKYKKTTRRGRKRRTSKKQLGRGQGWSIPLGDSVQPRQLQLDHTLPVANIANIFPVREYPSCNGNQCNTRPEGGPRQSREKPTARNPKKRTRTEQKAWKEYKLWKKNREI